MSYTNKTLEELNVLDDFLMNAIVANTSAFAIRVSSATDVVWR